MLGARFTLRSESKQSKLKCVIFFAQLSPSTDEIQKKFARFGTLCFRTETVNSRKCCARFRPLLFAELKKLKNFKFI